MVIIKKEHPDSSDEDMDEGGLASFDRHIKQEQLESFYSDSLASFSDPVIKQEHISLSDDDSLTYTVHLSDEAMSWDGYNMQQLDGIFNTMRALFQRVVRDLDSSYQDCYDQEMPFKSDESVKFDLQDACCYFIEHENVPRIHQARANLMMVWLIETETESARYADTADGIIVGLDNDVLKMFGVSDERVEDLKKDLLAAQDEVVRRTVDAEAEMDEDEGE